MPCARSAHRRRCRDGAAVLTRILVTGGSSPLGDVLVPLLAKEFEVIAVARSAASAARLRAHEVDILPHDLRAGARFPSLEAMPVVHAAGISLAHSLGSLLSRVRPGQLIVSRSASATGEGHPRREDVLTGERLLQ